MYCVCVHACTGSLLCAMQSCDWGVATVKFGVPFPQFNDEKRLMGYHQNLQNIIEDQVRGGNV